MTPSDAGRVTLVADGDEHAVCVPGAPVGGGNYVGVKKARFASPSEDNTHGSDVLAHVLALVRVAGDPLGIGERRAEVHLRLW